jgi:hypothetical protein
MLVIEGVLMVALATSPKRCDTKHSEVRLELNSGTPWLTTTTAYGLEPDVLFGESLEIAMAKDFACVPQVRHVMAEHVDGPFLVWIAVDDPTPEVRARIYQKEMELIDAFPEIDFDFNVVLAMGRSYAEIATGASVIYSR